MRCDGILYHFEECFRAICCADLELVQQLYHQACKALVCPRNPHVWANFYENIARCVDVHLELS